MRLCAEEKYGIWRILNKELHFPLHGLQEVVLVQVSYGNQLEIRAKKGRILNYTEKRNSWRNETAMDNLQAWKMAAKSWSLLPFAFHVNAMLNLSSPWPDVRPVFFDPFLKTCFVEQCFLQWLFFNHFLQQAAWYILHLPWQSKQETHNSTVPVANRKHCLMPHAMKSS